MTGGREGRAIFRWLQRPYVAQRQRTGPMLTNFAALAGAVLVQAITIWLLASSPLPFFVAPMPATAMLTITAALWLNETEEQRYAYDD